MVKKFDPLLIPIRPDLSHESPLWAVGVQRVAGVDEAGRGAWAGPVAAGAVVFPPDENLCALLPGVRDSKQMAACEREMWAGIIRQAALDWGIGFASRVEIDALGIVPATRLAMQRALEKLASPPQHLLVDFLPLPEIPIPQTPLVKGDARSLSIAAASVLAKTARDAWMSGLDTLYPGYGFASHKGYGTPGHRLVLSRLGCCDEHRRTYEPIAHLADTPDGPPALPRDDGESP
jgi:ribonuclease HII